MDRDAALAIASEFGGEEIARRMVELIAADR